ncbi:MAG: rod shape-determining protein RodA [Candidatus Eremiobacteraeota bacterium]|nr:rod shape-determining protein RodA [Candidatus Eremiobacteraeota bacterium]
MKRRWLRNINWTLIVACISVTILGLVCIQSATLHDPSAALEYKKQALYAAMGVGLMIAFASIDYRNWQRWAIGVYAVNCLLLAFILVKGHSALGAQRWISFGPLGTFQPSEPAKLALAMVIAAILCRSEYKRLRDVWLPLLAVGVPALLILRQPDLGTMLVVLAILSAQLYFGLPRLTHFAVFTGALAAVAAFTLRTKYVLKPFQKARLSVFLNPKADPQGAGWNLNQSKIAVGSGGWFGKGLHHGTQTQLNFVPEHSRDFIFTVVGEELGFLGAAMLIGLYAFIIWGAIRSMLSAQDRFAFLLASGIVAMLVFHIVVNIGMTLGIMPITGIPLPFMSYGGSSIVTNYAAVGVLLNIYLQRDRVVLGNA